jgi:hypothetical protein
MFENPVQTRCAICGTGILLGLVLARVVDPATAHQIVGLITGMGMTRWIPGNESPLHFFAGN